MAKTNEAPRFIMESRRFSAGRWSTMSWSCHFDQRGNLKDYSVELHTETPPATAITQLRREQYNQHVVPMVRFGLQQGRYSAPLVAVPLSGEITNTIVIGTQVITIEELVRGFNFDSPPRISDSFQRLGCFVARRTVAEDECSIHLDLLTSPFMTIGRARQPQFPYVLHRISFPHPHLNSYRVIERHMDESPADSKGLVTKIGKLGISHNVSFANGYEREELDELFQ